MILRSLLILFFFFQSILSANSTYTIDAEYFPEKDFVNGRQIVTFTNDFSVPVDKVYFAIDNTLTEPNPELSKAVNDIGYVNGYTSSPIIINSVKDKNGKLHRFEFENELQYIKIKTYANSKNIFFVALKKPLSPGKTVSFTIDFTTHIPEKYNIGERLTLKDTTTLRFAWYPTEFTHDDKAWVLNKFVFNKASIKQLTLTVPKKYEVVMAGEKFETHQTDTKTIARSESSIPRFGTSVIISPKLNTLTAKTSDGVSVEVVYLDKDRKREAQFILDAALDVIPYYNRNFGQIPLKRLVIANSPVMGDWGMASNSFIFLGDGAIGSAQVNISHYMNRWLTFLVAHEIGHLWAGVGNDVDFNTDNYLSEGLTNYLTFDYFENRFGILGNMFEPESGLKGHFLINYNYLNFETALYKHQNNYRLTKRDSWHEPLSLANEKSNLHNKESKDYSIGYLTFRHLENYMGKESFQKGLKSYFLDNKDYYTIDDFKMSLQPFSERGLSPFFDDWFKGIPALDVSIGSVSSVKEGDQFVDTVVIKKTGKAVTDLDVAFVYDTQTVKKRLRNLNLNSTILNQSNQVLRNVILDPESKLLDDDRRNNTFKRKLDFYYFGNSKALLNRKPLEHYFIGVTPFLMSSSLYGAGDLLGPGLKLFGTDHFSHFWKAGVAGKYSSLSERSSTAVFAEYTFLLPRFHYLNVSSTYDSNKEWDSSVSYVQPLFRPVDIGLYGHYYYPEHTLFYTLKRYNYSSNELSYSAKLSWQYTNLKTLYWHTISAEISPKISLNDLDFEKYYFNVLKAFSLKPRVLLVPQSTIGLGRNMQSVFSANSIRGQGIVGNRQGQKMFKQSVDLIIPIQYGRSEDVGKLFVYRGMAVAGFLEAGNTFTNDNAFDEGVLTGGGELNILLTSVADMKLAVSLGYGVTLARSDVYDFSEEIYFSFKTPLSIYAYFFGY
ncbi:hypothetical protein DID80_04560 [Candidatus Marinamargulisbacteria bacterium SCGC AAA071-K20]|nr:hypothetical protein DID80_04560 [Candidatus Marinamargulisbacteria bacterium SCGC AAA071-K20]